MSPEVLGFLGAIVAGIFGVLQFRAERRANRADKRADALEKANTAANERASELETTLNDRIKKINEASDALIANLHQEIERLQTRQTNEEKAHAAQITRMEETIKGLGRSLGALRAENQQLHKQVINDRLNYEQKIDALESQIQAMQKMYQEEAQRWGIERQDMLDEIDARKAQVAALEQGNRLLEEKVAKLADCYDALEVAMNRRPREEDAA